MKRLLVFIFAFCFLLSAFADTSAHIVVSARDFGQNLKPGVRATLTPLAPINARTISTNIFSVVPLAQTLNTNSTTTFSNMLWGYYRLDLSGTPTTTFNLVLGTNQSGLVSAAALITNAVALPPNPATNYYTMAQADAIHATLTNNLGFVGNNGITCTTNSGVVTCGLYTAPTVASITNSIGTIEVGYGATNPILGWTRAGSTATSQSLNQGIGAINAATNTYTHTGYGISNYVSTRTYTLTISDGTTTNTGSTSIYWKRKAYWGISTSTSLSNAQILAFANDWVSGTTRTFTLSPVDQYTYYCYPDSNTGTSTFVVGGLDNTDWGMTTQYVTNAPGWYEVYKVYRTGHTFTGQTTTTATTAGMTY